MHDLVQHIDTFLSKYQPERLIVACSAGLDSTVLLHACSKLEVSIEMAHVNYQLRGEASEKDQQFLEALANDLKIPIHVNRIDLQEQLKNGGNLQELARNERYALFHSIRKSDPKTFVLLAHHKEDQTETFFMNLARNAGIMGLAGMPENRSYFLRPLLTISKEQLRVFAIENAIQWREDTSNESLKYTRNRWRKEVLPELRNSLPDLDDAVSILTNSFQQTQLELESSIEVYIDEIRETQMLSISTFHQLNVWEKVELCRQLGQSPSLLDTWNKLSHKGTFVELKKSKLNFEPTKIVHDGDVFSFILEEPLAKKALTIEEVEALPSVFSKRVIYLDASKITGQLRFRRTQSGDRIHPIGMKGSRLVSDVISDAKLTSIQKGQLQVLVDDNHIHWVPELCVSRKAVANKKCEKILKIGVESML